MGHGTEVFRNGINLTSNKFISLCALQALCVIEANQLMIFKKIIDDFSDVLKKHKKELWLNAYKLWAFKLSVT